jgi:hypothetical protein
MRLFVMNFVKDNPGNDWQSRLRRKLDSLGREAWVEYQSNPRLMKGWATAAHEGLREYSVTAATDEKEMILGLEREIMEGPQSRNGFVGYLCGDVALLLCVMLYPGLAGGARSATAEVVLDGLSAAFGSIPEYSPNLSPKPGATCSTSSVYYKDQQTSTVSIVKCFLCRVC